MIGKLRPDGLLAAAIAAVFLFVAAAAEAKSGAGYQTTDARILGGRGVRRFSPPARSRPTATLQESAACAFGRADRDPAGARTGRSRTAAIPAMAPCRALTEMRLSALARFPAPIMNFEGLSSLDNFNTFGFRVNPPDPVGGEGPNNYVEMVNLTVGIYSKTGTLILGPVDIGALWSGFAIEDCTDPSGDPVVVYDQLADRLDPHPVHDPAGSTQQRRLPPSTTVSPLSTTRGSDGLVLQVRLPDAA